MEIKEQSENKVVKENINILVMRSKEIIQLQSSSNELIKGIKH